MKILIVGMGLIGGSVCKALKNKTQYEVYGCDVDESVLQQALQDHAIDGTGKIAEIKEDSLAIWYTIEAPPQILRYIVEKGSIAIDGISLTVAKVTQTTFSVSTIPHTRSATTLGERRPGDLVNLENDCIGKYVEHLLKREEDKAQQKSGLTKEFLYQCGF